MKMFKLLKTKIKKQNNLIGLWIHRGIILCTTNIFACFFFSTSPKKQCSLNSMIGSVQRILVFSVLKKKAIILITESLTKTWNFRVRNTVHIHFIGKRKMFAYLCFGVVFLLFRYIQIFFTNTTYFENEWAPSLSVYVTLSILRVPKIIE